MRDPHEHEHPDLLDEALEDEPGYCGGRWREPRPLRRCVCGATYEDWRFYCRWCGRRTEVLAD